jgi:hypothetical protein
MGSANSDSVGRYSGARGRLRSHAGTGVSAGPPAAAAAGGDIGAQRLGFWGPATGSRGVEHLVGLGRREWRDGSVASASVRGGICLRRRCCGVGILWTRVESVGGYPARRCGRRHVDARLGVSGHRRALARFSGSSV